MAMSTGGGGGVKSEINVTPLVDVVLVLLIIFMVITPLLQMGYEVTTPPEIESAVPPPPSDQIVVRLDAEGRTWINRQEIPRASFGTKLSELMEKRSSKVVFFAADGSLPYSQVAEFLDLCRNHGAKELGMVFDDL
jgi:biopolymer transport protein ExbD